jgi:LysM repeat protein
MLDPAPKATDLPPVASRRDPSGSLPHDPFPTPGAIPGTDAGLPVELSPKSSGGAASPFDGLAAKTADAGANRGFPNPGGYDALPNGSQGQLGSNGPISPVVAIASGAFDSDWQLAMRQLEQGELANALETLSVWQGSPDLPPDEDARLQPLLDQLAGTVIYSTQHLIEPAHVVKVHERLQDIAARYHVPSQLLANINGIADPDTLLPGQRLKVVPGPFTARVDVERQQIVLYARRYYAGRFFFTPGRDQPPRSGDFEVVSKMVDRTWYDRNGHEVPPQHPENPYGPYWIGLGADQSIHGLASSSGRGCMGLAPRDAEDLYAILGVGSEVKIR